MLRVREVRRLGGPGVMVERCAEQDRWQDEEPIARHWETGDHDMIHFVLEMFSRSCTLRSHG